MKKLIALLICSVSISAFAATEKATKELEKAMTGDYQTLRNVAFAMKDGSFGHDKNPVATCALRKVILIVNQDKTDITDYNNEAIDCGKLKMDEQKSAWEIALKSLSIILKHNK